MTFNPIKDRKNIHAGTRLSGTIRETDGSFRSKSNIGKIFDEYGQRFNIWHLPPDKQTGKFGHPAVFPEALARDHILSWSNEGDTVLDPFCGSGTTGKMAAILKRNFVGIDISADYCALAEARIQRAKGIPADIPRFNKRQIETPLFG